MILCHFIIIIIITTIREVNFFFFANEYSYRRKSPRTPERIIRDVKLYRNLLNYNVRTLSSNYLTQKTRTQLSDKVTLARVEKLKHLRPRMTGGGEEVCSFKSRTVFLFSHVQRWSDALEFEALARESYRNFPVSGKTRFKNKGAFRRLRLLI